MKQLQLIFDEQIQLKTETKIIKSSIAEALENSKEYQLVKDQIESLKLKKRHIEEAIKTEFSSELNKLDELKTELENNKVMTTDMALSKMLAGEEVEVEHKGIKYIPVWSVKFVKA